MPDLIITTMVIMLLTPGNNNLNERGASISVERFNSYESCLSSMKPVVDSMVEFIGKARTIEWNGVKHIEYVYDIKKDSITATSGFVPNNTLIFNNVKITVKCVKAENEK